MLNGKQYKSEEIEMSHSIAELETEPIQIEGSFNYIDIVAKADNRFVIAGYASFDMIDKQGDKVALEALGEAFDRMMKVVERRNLMFHHTNIQIGRLLPEYTDAKNKVWKSGLTKQGLFVVADVFDDVQKAKEVREEMKKGHYLSFSIGGQALQRKTVCDGQTCWSNILKLDLHEITSCPKGVNPASKAFTLKQDSSCFINIAKMASFNDTLINERANDQLEEIIMSEKKKTDVSTDADTNIEKTDLQVVLDAIAKLSSDVETLKAEKKPEEEEEEEKKARKKPEEEEEEEEEEKKSDDPYELLESMDEELKGKLPEGLRRWMEERRKKKKAEGITKDDILALITEALEEHKAKKKPEEEEEEEGGEKKPNYYYKKPKKEDFEEEKDYDKAVEEYNELREEIGKELKGELGDVITKSKIPPVEGEETLNFEKYMNESEDVMGMKHFMQKEGMT